MHSLLNRQEIKWGLLAIGVLIIPFWPPFWPLSLAVALVCLHAALGRVPLQPLRLLGAVVVGLSAVMQRVVSLQLPRLDNPELLLVVPFLFGSNMLVGAFIPRSQRLLRPGRLLGLGLIWLAFYLFAPLPGVTWTNLSQMGWFGWLLLLAGGFGLLVGDYHRPLQGLRDLRADSYWHGRRLTEQEEQVREGGRQGERSVQAVLETLDRQQYTCYHGVHLRSQHRQLPRSQEYDHIVVGPNGVFHLETKNWRGKVVVKPSGDWFRAKEDGSLQPWESPAEQVERHRQVLLSVLADVHVPVVGCLVMTNPSTSFEGLNHVPVRVIRVEQLKQLIESWRPEQPLGKELRAAVNQRIAANIISSEQFETGGKFIWQLWHWLLIDGALAALYFWFSQR